RLVIRPHPRRGSLSPLSWRRSHQVESWSQDPVSRAPPLASRHTLSLVWNSQSRLDL
ncbi:hypothetical protein LEMLEM_LOCUS15961, partial [Lemmus lemmus]